MTIFLSTLLSLLFLVSSFGCGEGVVLEDLKLESRNGVMYLPNHEEPYTGQYVTWYENGQKATEAMHKAGKKNGLATLWYENGQKWNEITYKDGNPDGRFTGWHENGQKYFDGIYKDGLKDGVFTEWDEQGNIIRKTTYKKGEKVL